MNRIGLDAEILIKILNKRTPSSMWRLDLWSILCSKEHELHCKRLSRFMIVVSFEMVRCILVWV